MPEQREKIGRARLEVPCNGILAKMARGLRLSFGSSDLSDWPLYRWPLAAEKLPTRQNEDDAASAAEFSF